MWKRITSKYYVKGYLDGYTDAETEFFENSDHAITAYNNGYKDAQEDLDVAYWQGYNNAMVDMSTNKDIEPMSTNDDIWKMSEDADNDGWYTDGITYMTKEHIIKQWNELFDANPWLEGFAADENCGIIDCCQETEPQDWLVFDQVTTLLWLSNLENEKVMTKDLIQKIGGIK